VTQHLIQSRFRRRVCPESVIMSNVRCCHIPASRFTQFGIAAEIETYPSSKSRKFVADPESLEIKTMVRMGTCVARSFWAVMMGPIVLVRRWYSKSAKELAQFGVRIGLSLAIEHARTHISVALLFSQPCKHVVESHGDRMLDSIRLDTSKLPR
jgi:hypothetical protein